MNGNGCLTYAFITEAYVSSELTNIPIQHNRPPYFFFFPLLLSHRIPKAKAKQRSGGRWAPLSTDGHYTPPPPLCSRICRRRFLFRGPFFAFHSSIHGSSSQFRFVLIFSDWYIHESFDAHELTLMLIYLAGI